MDLIKEYFEAFTPDTWVAQIVGVFALVVGILSYWQKEHKKQMILQFAMSVGWCVHMLMLGAISGFILNLVAITRQVIILCSEKYKWANFNVWFWIILVLFGIATGISWYLGDGAKALIPLAAMVLMSVAFKAKNPTFTRIISLIAGPLWFAYDIINFSVAGMLNEAICFLSTSVSVLKLDLLDKKREQN